MSLLTSLDAYLGDEGPAALVLRDELAPVEGPEGVFFPPTYAKSEDGKFEGGYNIDGKDGEEKICLVDSVGSQANRIEPIFGREPYMKLVPQISIRAGDRMVRLLDAGHRAGDAIVRSSALQEKLQHAFLALLRGNAEPLAKLAPTSLVFGVWDSRDTQAKAPRLIASTIRAYDVRRLTRSATYIPPIEYVDNSLLEEPKEKAKKELYSQRGFLHALASASHGGVIARKGIRREATLSLAALRLLSAAGDVKKTRALQRYVLGLAVTAFTANISGYLRQGCNLVLDATKKRAREIDEVYPSGKRKEFVLSHEDAVAYANEAAKAFGVGEDRVVDFDKTMAERDTTENGKKKGKK